jgi:hypothetical protein
MEHGISLTQSDKVVEVDVLVDLDNVSDVRITSSSSAERALDALQARLVPPLKMSFPALRRVRIGLYYAHEKQRNQPTAEYRHLTLVLGRGSAVRDASTGVDVRFHQDLMMPQLGLPAIPTLFKHRSHACCGRRGFEQKLVDTYLVSDLALSAEEGAQDDGYAVAIASEDVDMVPGILQARYLAVRENPAWGRERIVWLRRPGRIGANYDSELVKIATLVEWVV